MSSTMEKLVILGSGPAGCTAAIYAARAGIVPILLAGPLPGGLLTQTPKIENYPGFPDPISGFDLTDAMLRQAELQGARVRYQSAKSLQLDGTTKKITLDDGSLLETRTVILALGAQHKPLPSQGKARLQGSGISYCATCDGAFYRQQAVALAGNGSAALNEALYLSALASEVHLLVPAPTLKGPRVLLDRVSQSTNIIVHLRTRPADTVADDDGKLTQVVMEDLSTRERIPLACKGLFVALGFQPDTSLLHDTGIALDDDGYIKLVAPERTLTSLPGVFAAGDCTDPRYKQAVIAAASGAKAALDAADFLRENNSPSPQG